MNTIIGNGIDQESSSSSSAQQTEFPQARHHTYLPGSINPLMIHNNNNDNDITTSTPTIHINNNNKNKDYISSERPNWVQELAIYELQSSSSSSPLSFAYTDNNNTNNNNNDQNENYNNIVIYPGSIVPLRLFDKEFILYIRQQIVLLQQQNEMNSTTSNTTTTSSSSNDINQKRSVRFGILIPKPNRNSNNNDRNNTNDNDIHDDDNDYYPAVRDNNTNNNNNDNFHHSPMQQRQSWTRQGHGPIQLRRLSDQLIHILGPDFDYDMSDDSNDDNDDADDNDSDSNDDDNNENDDALVSMERTIVSEPERYVRQRSNEYQPLPSISTPTVPTPHLPLFRTSQPRQRQRQQSIPHHLRQPPPPQQQQEQQQLQEMIVNHRNPDVSWRVFPSSRPNIRRRRDRDITVNSTRSNTNNVNDNNINNSNSTFRRPQYTTNTNTNTNTDTFTTTTTNTNTGINTNRNTGRTVSATDKYIGRIGIIVTVLYTHDNSSNTVESNQPSSSNTSNDTPTSSGSSVSASSLVITAMGTSRFQIVGYRTTNEQQEYNNISLQQQQQQQRQQQRYFSIGNGNNNNNKLKYFLIEEINDTSISLPFNTKQHSTGRTVTNATCDLSDNTNRNKEQNTDTSTTTTFHKYGYYQSQIQYLSMVSSLSIPYSLLLQNIWPWKIMSDICDSILSNPDLQGLLVTSSSSSSSSSSSTDVTAQSQQVEQQETIEGVHDSDHTTIKEKDNNVDMVQSLLSKGPVGFSFWMASNLPFRYFEKVQLLEIRSTMERLRYIYNKITNEGLGSATIHCQHCLVCIAKIASMFTVDGADGTTGNYVNEHGIVHQTITLRTITEEDVWYQGEAQTQDSWFPGYSWRIMSCAVCGHHLGWKYTLTNNESSNHHTNESVQRPSVFFGVSAANVSTIVPNRSSRMNTSVN